jgi:hypothetical protein
MTNLELTLRAYERAHRIWMNTVVWSPEADSVRAHLATTRKEYIAAYDEHTKGGRVERNH